MVTLAGCRRLPPPQTLEVGETKSLDIQTVRYCAPAELPVRDARVQVLVDSSGSMQGFTSLLEPYEDWVEQALSGVRNTGAAFRETRHCFFSAGQGIAPCSASRLAGRRIPPGGNTNLHEAIGSARNFDLSVILTDGVAATVNETGDCAGSVDAACVARSLRAALQAAPGAPQDAYGGLWIVPLAAMYDGPYFTEQRLPATAFREAAILDAVRRDTATSGVASNPHVDGSGRLAYAYRGPRALFILVLARPAELGRAFVAALSARRAAGHVISIASLREFQNGLAVLPPIEVYPGYHPPVRWASAAKEVAGGREVEQGALGFDLQREAGRLELGCTSAASQAVLNLKAEPQAQVADCAEMRVLPSLELRRTTVPSVASAELRGEGLQARLLVSCAGNAAPCDASAPVMEWRVSPQFSASADRLAQTAGADAGLGAISSADSLNEPHRIYGLRETLVKFYRECAAAGETPSTSVARLAVCRKQ